MSYTKLFSSIVTSTIWTEDANTCKIWVTMLAIADKHGEVHASIPGLAQISGMTVSATETAIEKFLSPDKYSRTSDEGGRRIEKIDGGWMLLNHAKYRAMASKEESITANAERQRRFKRRKAGMSGDAGQCVYCGDPSTGPDHVIPTSKGGANDSTNVVHACGRCNCHKGTQRIDVFLNDPSLGFDFRHDLIQSNPVLSRLLTFDNGRYKMVTSSRDIAEAEADTEADIKNKTKPKRVAFHAPSLSDVEEYGKTLSPQFRKASSFIDFYESKGWLVGKSPMKSWQAAVRTWNGKDAQKPVGGKHAGINTGNFTGEEF